MIDTPKEIQKLQMEIIMSKSLIERMEMGFDMIDSVYKMVFNSIKAEQPNLSKREIIAAVFRRYYQKDFSPKVLEEISDQIRKYQLQ